MPLASLSGQRVLVVPTLRERSGSVGGSNTQRKVRERWRVYLNTHYVLIDFENVQPCNLDALKPEKVPFNVMVFVGSNQAKIPFDLAAAMQRLGSAARYVKIAGTSKNALDFHIAYYIGELVVRERDAYFTIISRDTGFDTLIKHLKSRGINIQRERVLEDVSYATKSEKKPTRDEVSVIANNLRGRGHARPRSAKTLYRTIDSLFPEKLSEQRLRSLVQELERRQYVKVSKGIVSYSFPPRK